ncbi:MAG TPA: tetratricopeptide repeat protein [Gemmatimonadaceae bacterium]|nr:tetratricopeptide repeat protein [Gemmatimonadaceae bacterium]
MPNQDLDRIFEHLADSQYDEALRLLDGLIEALPSHARLHALRAFVLVRMDRPTEASISVERALALDEFDSYVYHAAAEVALAHFDPHAAIAAANKARELDPESNAAIFLEAHARMLLGQWGIVRVRMDYILGLEPNNEHAAVLRATALELRQEGKGPLTDSEWAELSRKFPLNSVARTGYAWRVLEQGRRSDAEEEFRQALALDPSSKSAKHGLVLALKAKYPGYGLLLRFFFWIYSLEPRTRTLLAIGGVVVYNSLKGTMRDNPEMKPVILPFLIAYMVFVFAAWLADPLLSLLLMLRREGRQFLSDDDKKSGILVGCCLGAGILLGLAGAFTPWRAALNGAVAIAVTSITIAGAYNCAAGTDRSRLLLAAGMFVALGLMSTLSEHGGGPTLTLIVIFGVVISAWVARSWSERSHPIQPNRLKRGT